MRIRTLSIPVSDQQHALEFYTEKLGFIKRHDVPVGGGNRWLTVVSSEEPDGPEILLEPAPLHFEPSKVFQKAVYDAGMPWTQFEVTDVDAEHERLAALGVEFSTEPTDTGDVRIAVFDDTCGNRLLLVQTSS